MNQEPYEKYKKEKLILRDWLAVDRTELANERTFLAYIRTSLTAIIVGVGLIGYFETGIYANFGILLVPIGLILLFIGTYRFITKRKNLEKLFKQEEKKK